MGANHSQVSPGAALPQPALQKQQAVAHPTASHHPPQPVAAPGAQQQQQQQQQQQRPVLRRRSSSQRGYHPRSASLRRMRSIHRRRILDGSARAPAKRNARMEAESRKRQEEKHLLAACARGDLKKVEKLVDCGVDVNSADQNQMTALHYAAMHAREEVIKSLISRGAEVNTADLKGGFTAMHWIVINAEPQYGSTDHLEKSLTALARAGCRVNATDFNFATPLHIASQKGNKGCVQALMRLGADPMKVDITGRSCFEVAKDDQTRALLKRLHEKYATKPKENPVYRVLEIPPPSMPAPAPPPAIPPPRLVAAGKSASEDEEHLYNTPEVVTPPTSPSQLRFSSATPPPPPPRRRRQYTQYSNDMHMYHVLEMPAPKPRGSRALSPPRRRKSRKH